jgi:hypothetical protein
VGNLLKSGKVRSPALVAELGNGTQDHRAWVTTTFPIEFQYLLIFLDLFYSASWKITNNNASHNFSSFKRKRTSQMLSCIELTTVLIQHA